MVQGWHRGERAIQKKIGYDGVMTMGWTSIDEEMPEQHREFYTTRLPFIPVTTVDDEGRPWSCILAGASGGPRFASSPEAKWNQLDMKVRVWEGDPFAENIQRFWSGEKVLVAGIGIEFSTRRRNKFAGYISAAEKCGNNEYRVSAIVNEAIGNCPKYINIRQLDPHPDTHPTVVYQASHLAPGEKLPEEVIQFVQKADTIFIGSTYVAEKQDEPKFPSHVGQNQRGGKPGFVRVRSDGRTVVVPDYSGNRIMSSLGNIEATPLGSLTIVDFVTGDILYFTSEAHNIVGHKAQAIMPRQNVITQFNVTGYRFVRDALPVRQRAGTEPLRSLYSPPVRLLAEESASAASMFTDEQITLSLSSIVMHSQDLATFTWQTSKPVHIVPGQTAMLDFTELVGAQKYAHMAPLKPNSINDDRIRTWTVSSAHPSPVGTTSFALTMREKPGGTVTGALFTIARKLAENRPELMQDARPLQLQVRLVGIAGDFQMPISSSLSGGPPSNDSGSVPISLGPPATPRLTPIPLLWIAGGIGITPFLSMLAAIARSSGTQEDEWDIKLLLSTREPEVMVSLINAALDRANDQSPSGNIRLQVDIFTGSKPLSFSPPQAEDVNGINVSFIMHPGRINADTFDSVDKLGSRSAYLCGPKDFERDMLDKLKSKGYEKHVMRESFEY